LNGFHKMNLNELIEVSRKSRIRALQMTSKASAAHIGSSLSLIEIAVVLFDRLKNSRKGNIFEDSVLISKGHAAAGVYAVLAELNLIPSEWTDNYCENGSKLGGHITSTNIPFLELSTGSLGHALPFAIGRSLAMKKLGKSGRVYVVLSDGECDEGSNWEAALLAPHLNLDNLTVIIDRNRMQSLDGTESTVGLEPLIDKWRAFNWECRNVDGHNIEVLVNNMQDGNESKPLLLIADTTKGKGISFMENNIKWHYRPPSSEELALALKELSL